MIVLKLPLAPSANSLWVKGKKGLYKSKKYKDWLEEAGWMVKQQTRDSIEGQYVIHISALRVAKRRDLDNIIKATSDLMVVMGIVEDDSLCMALAAEWTTMINAPMVVTIYGAEESDEEQRAKNLQ
jgi:crossover junction endodeoxyribonuclease RusA